MKKYNREDAIALLFEKSRELSEAGEQRLPRRSDFTDEEVTAIKAHLGPWPRALEAAELKPQRSFDRLERNRAKRAASKLRRKQQTDTK